MELSDHREAYRWAVRALAGRMRSVHEIESGLQKRGYSKETVSHVTEKLVCMGYLNDSQFASQWVLSRSSNRHYGRVRMRDELKKKGISKDLAEDALNDHLPDQEERKIAERAVLKRLKNLRESGMRGKAILYRFLKSRGFTSQAIFGALSIFDEERKP